MAPIKFRLFVAGATSQSLRAIANLREICQEELPGCHEIEVIDVLEHPRLAEREKIIATPTLVAGSSGGPVRKIIGNLTDRRQVLLGIDLERIRRELQEPRR